MLVLRFVSEGCQSFRNAARSMSHFKCRSSQYPRSDVRRIEVPDEKVAWESDWEDYKPPYYTSAHIIKQSWADPEMIEGFKPVWNSLDGNVNRKSHIKSYSLKNGYPLNPVGRTGLGGRGVLGRWGPNHAADPIVTRWKRNADNSIVMDKSSNKPILQFVGIKRRDCNEWAIPGGMVDPGEVVTATLKREFLEEALNLLEMNDKNKENLNKLVQDFFSSGIEIYKGYVDDPRNTDNAWIETVVHNFHDENSNFVGTLNLTAGDDAIGVKWLDISSKLALYASHSHFVQLVAARHQSHW